MKSLFKNIFFCLYILFFMCPTTKTRSFKIRAPKKTKNNAIKLDIAKNGYRFLKEQKSDPSNIINNLLPVQNGKMQANPFMVRVLLAQAEAEENINWTLKAENGFFVVLENKQTLCINTKAELRLNYMQGVLYINGKAQKTPKCIIIAKSGNIMFNERYYAGAFWCDVQNDTIYLINELPLEEYVACVLNSESWPGWPLEVNKAFAIASRSYLIAKILEARKQKRIYHIKNSNIHQTYKGMHNCQRLQQAIEQTQGLILTYNKKPIEAMFDSCCGGIIPGHMDGFDFIKAPYLKRTTTCTYCKTCKIYTWKIEYPVTLFESILHKAGHSIKNIKDIKVTKDMAGIVRSVLIKGLNKSLHLTGKQMYSLFDKLKSFAYSVEKRGKSILFSGRGYGHHLGICQWGARRMIDAGMNFASILKFYYPGACIMELKHTISNKYA